eukprot:CAMPEP_0119006698 /NCGR_PEP_ID=MMETSP1176-20130426/2472_1 /TAXON_ID=265551 /ORGANISM="Synedropsis recta cf, Strain CCMP1620" /LENGTH=266 /DNA_ID=CAMNT_0006958661 /DNA_START=95 /DNA_END=895 /DNA_ORIENTATION=-
MNDSSSPSHRSNASSSLRSSTSSSFRSSASSSSKSLRAMVSGRSLIAAGDSFRKTSYRTISVGLQFEKLETLLCEISQDYCECDVLVRHIRAQFSGLAARNTSNKDLSRQELGEIVDALQEIVNTSPRLSPKVVAYIHSTIGLVRQLRGENDAAIHAFMKALWIATATHEPNAVEIGLTVHRLGIVHGQNGNLNQAATMLEKALAIYQSAELTEAHPYVISVTTEIEVVRPKLLKELWRAGSTPAFHTVNEELDHLKHARDRRLSS